MNKNNKRVLGIISARGGSKRLPGKNLIPLQGKPLIAWTIEAGLTSNCIDRLILSTDNPEISKVALKFGCEVPFVRPQEIATDEASSVDVVKHALSQISGYDYFVLLQPTSPFRRGSHIDEAFNMMCAAEANSCVSICKSTESPKWMLTINGDGYISRLIKDNGEIKELNNIEAYIPNGAIYISEINKFLSEESFYSNETFPYVMSLEHSVDIDTNYDLKFAESLL